MADLEAEFSLSQTAEEVLRRRADSLAREAIEEEVTDRQSLLLFRIGEEWYSVRVSDVREIFQEYEITPVPGVPDYVLGVVNVRGEILSVTDPAKLMRLGRIQVEQGDLPAIVVIFEDIATAMVVDEIGDITEVANESIEPPVSIIDRAQAEFISATVHIENTMVGLINTERMLEPVVTSGRH